MKLISKEELFKRLSEGEDVSNVYVGDILDTTLANGNRFMMSHITLATIDVLTDCHTVILDLGTDD